MGKITIDYKKIVMALNYYKRFGYDFLDVPWFVSREAMEVTSPPDRRYCSSFIGDLVASGEQSFIQMWLNGDLKKGKWHCVTPCFRDEPCLDNIHLNYFFKVELIEVEPLNISNSIEEMVECAKSFFNIYLSEVNVVDTDIGKDLISSNGIELGSYGYREHEGFHWVYGTGIAEPRLSYVESFFNN